MTTSQTYKLLQPWISTLSTGDKVELMQYILSTMQVEKVSSPSLQDLGFNGFDSELSADEQIKDIESSRYFRNRSVPPILPQRS